MSSKIPFLVGQITLQSSLSLEEVGQILSEKIFGGLKFGGKELEIHEEVPAIFIEQNFLGLQIVLDGYSGMGHDTSFELSIQQMKTFKGKENQTVNLDEFLFELLKEKLKDVTNIFVK